MCFRGTLVLSLVQTQVLEVMGYLCHSKTPVWGAGILGLTLKAKYFVPIKSKSLTHIDSTKGSHHTISSVPKYILPQSIVCLVFMVTGFVVIQYSLTHDLQPSSHRWVKHELKTVT